MDGTWWNYQLLATMTHGLGGGMGWDYTVSSMIQFLIRIELTTSFLPLLIHWWISNDIIHQFMGYPYNLTSDYNHYWLTMTNHYSWNMNGNSPQLMRSWSLSFFTPPSAATLLRLGLRSWRWWTRPYRGGSASSAARCVGWMTWGCWGGENPKFLDTFPGTNNFILYFWLMT